MDSLEQPIWGTRSNNTHKQPSFPEIYFFTALPLTCLESSHSMVLQTQWPFKTGISVVTDHVTDHVTLHTSGPNHGTSK